MHPRLTELATYLEAQRGALLRAAAPLAHDDWTRPRDAGRWSVSEVCEHLHRVERGTARLIAKRAGEARAAGHPAESSTASVMGRLAFANLTDRSIPREAPERVLPQGGWSREAALAALASSRDEMRAALLVADGLALETVRQEHPRLGEIDLYQWILFIGEHEARHVAQIAEIAQLLSSPAALAPSRTTSSGDA